MIKFYNLTAYIVVIIIKNKVWYHLKVEVSYERTIDSYY